jgi:hypothetical protein
MGLSAVGQTHLVGIPRRTNREFGTDFLDKKSSIEPVPPAKNRVAVSIFIAERCWFYGGFIVFKNLVKDKAYFVFFVTYVCSLRVPPTFLQPF